MTDQSAIKPYAPRANSYAARAHEALAAARGGVLSSAALAEAIDLEHAEQLPPILAIARRHGYLVAERREKMLWWRIGNGQSATDPDIPPEEQNDAQVEQEQRKLEAAGRLAREEPLRRNAPTSIFDLAARRGVTEAGVKALERDDTPLRVALWSDGELVIRANGMELVLAAEQTRKLVDFLDRLAP